MTKVTAMHCVVVTSFDENQPGFLDFSYRIQSLLKRYKVTLVLKKPLTRAELSFECMDVCVIPTQHGKWGWLLYQWDVARYIHMQKPDLVVLLHSALAPLGCLLRSFPTCLYWNEHPSNLAHLPERFHPVKTLLALVLQKCVYWGAKKAHLVMPIGEEHMADLIQHGVSESKICMLYMGVSEAFLPPKTEVTYKHSESELSHPIRVVYVGTISPSRGRDIMLDAMSLLAKQFSPLSLQLLLVGADEEQMTASNQRIATLQLQDYVTVKGRVSGSQVPAILHASDAALCLWPNTIWNQFNPPTKLFEYLTAGLVVVASNIRTHTRYVKQGVHGLIFDYSAQDLAQALQVLIERRSELSQLKTNARNAGQAYVWRDIEPVFLSRLEKLVSR